MLNIPSSVDDPSYRYKMPRIISKKEGRGNGSKTGIMNMGDVARAVKRDPVYLTKFFGYELGAQSAYTNKESEGERVVINGHHDTPVFQNLVDKFIDKYVLCVGCHLPEIDMVVKKGMIVATCKACGWNGDLDNGHKLASYILKNPPGTGIGFDAEKSKKTKEERQKEKAEKALRKKTEDDETASYQSEDEKKDKKSKKEKKEKDEDGEKKEKKEKKAKKEKKEKKEKKAKKEKKSKKDPDDEDDEEDGEVKEKKEKKEKKDKKDKKEKKDKKDKKEKKDKKDKKEKKEKSKGLEVDSDEAEEKDSDKDSDAEEEELKYDDEVMGEIVRDVTGIVKANPKITKDKLFEEVRTLQVTKLFDHRLRMYVVVSALYPEASLKADGIPSKKKFLNEFIQNAKMPFADWIWGFEAYLAQNPAATKAWPMALKALYDEDIAEEEHILAYYKEDHDNPGFDVSKKAVGPFLQWLQTSNDSDSDDDDDSDEDSD